MKSVILTIGSDEQMSMELTTEFLNYPLLLRAERIGPDINVLCVGGSQPHLGGCAIAVPYPRISGFGTSISQFSLPGHQDAVLAGAIAKQLCKQFQAIVFVQCGIHYDDLSAAELAALQTTILDLCCKLEV